MMQKVLIRLGGLILFLLGLGIAFGLFWIGIDRGETDSGYRTLYGYAGVFFLYTLMSLYIWGFWGKRYLSLELIVLFAVVFRTLLLMHEPLFDESVYRHAWDGKIYTAGVHPYSETPSSERLRGFRDEVIYPKVSAQENISPSSLLAIEVYRVIAFFSDWPFIYRLVTVIFDTISIFLLIAILRRMQKATAWVVLYAWNPVVIIESASHGHEMILAVFLMVLTLWFALAARPLYASFFVAVGASFHWLLLILVPFFEDIRSRWKTWIGVLLIVVAVFFFIHEGLYQGALSPWLHWLRLNWSAENNSGWFYVIQKIIAEWSGDADQSFFITSVLSCIIGTGMMFFLLYQYWKKSFTVQKQQMIRFVYWILATGLLLLPQLTPVTILMLLPILCLRPSAPWVLFSGMIGLYYFRHIPFFQGDAWYASVRLYEYVPFALWWGIAGLMEWKKRRHSFRAREML